MSNVQVFKSRIFVTKPVRAVFPQLQEPDKFGSFSISVDVLNDAELLGTLEAQAAETLAAAHAKFNISNQPTNSIVREGEYKGEANARVSFKMKSVRSVKGTDVPQRPAIVDSQKQPITEDVWGGSLVQIAYFIQFTTMSTGTYLSLKLKAVQVKELVNASGDASGCDAFEVDDTGYTSPTVVEPTVAVKPEASDAVVSNAEDF